MVLSLTPAPRSTGFTNTAERLYKSSSSSGSEQREILEYRWRALRSLGSEASSVRPATVNEYPRTLERLGWICSTYHSNPSRLGGNVRLPIKSTSLPAAEYGRIVLTPGSGGRKTAL